MPEPISPPTQPNRSPTYPQRVHIRERGQWNAVLAEWEAKIEEARGASKTSPESARILVQMLGARDQIADAARRMPMEVGDLYEEDHERLEAAVAALGRLFARWDALA